jgi:hypothetical protein
MARGRERGREMWSLEIGGKSDGSSFDNMDTRLANSDCVDAQNPDDRK